MNDHQAILQAIQAYFEGIFTGNVALLGAAFHPRAALFGEIKGSPYYKSLGDYLEAVASRQSPQARGEAFRMKVHAIDVQGPVAMARLRCPMLGFDYVDYLSFVRVDGSWLIASKTFTHIED